MGWYEQCRWDRRSAEFGEVRLQGLDVVMDYLPTLREQTLRQWQWLSPHTNVLEPLHGGLRYAALDWTRGKLALTDWRAITRFASWGVVLARLYQTVAADIAQPAWLAQPLVKFDVQRVMRVGFVNPELARLPPESLDQWPLMDEPALVFVVATALVDLATEIDWHSRVGELLSRALAHDRTTRYQTLLALQQMFAEVGGKQAPLVQQRSVVWHAAERTLGYLAAGRHDLAAQSVRDAVAADPTSMQVRDLVMRCHVVDAPPAPPLAWAEAHERGGACERVHDFAGALALYRRVDTDADAEVLALALAQARCHLALEEAEAARALADDVLAVDPACRDAHVIATRARLLAGRHTDALRAADAWLAVQPDHGPALHARGKALLGLNRLACARDAFDRACVRAPELIAAMWLRSAVDKALKQVRATTGVPVPMPVDLPEGPVRDALLAGRIDDAIALLPPSQLQGDLLSYVGRHAEALRVFEGLDGDAAVAGRARALIDLGRTDEALAILGTLDADADGFVVVVRR